MQFCAIMFFFFNGNVWTFQHHICFSFVIFINHNYVRSTKNELRSFISYAFNVLHSWCNCRKCFITIKWKLFAYGLKICHLTHDCAEFFGNSKFIYRNDRWLRIIQTTQYFYLIWLFTLHFYKNRVIFF